MSTVADITSGLSALTGRGFVVTVPPDGRLQVRPASRLTEDDRAWFRAHTEAILAHLSGTSSMAEDPISVSGNEPRDREVALKLMYDADPLVERFGVDGRHSAIANAAARVTGAADTRDMGTFRFAIAQFAVIVRRAVPAQLLAGGTE